MKTFKWFLSAVFALVANLAMADYEAGLIAAQNGDYETALREFTVAAEEGVMMAQYNLAILYFSGRGVEPDFEQAFHWTAAAADQGHTQAQFNLGALYYEGQGTRRDRQMALDWYVKAGNAEYTPAQYNVAEMYFLGDGIEKDPIRAHAWASRAVENDHDPARDLLENIEDGLSAADLREARRLLARMKIGMDR